MIGNDIVDLEFAKLNSRWQEQRFLDKLFSSEEQYFILSDGKRFQNIWRLWSMKESAYKMVSRADGGFRFNPKEFTCSILNMSKGHVMFENTAVVTQTETHPRFIQTMACSKPNFIFEVFELRHSDFKSQHIHSYLHAIKAYAGLKNTSKDLVSILKNEFGVPQLYMDGSVQKEQLSLSHHGNFGAFAIAV